MQTQGTINHDYLGKSRSKLLERLKRSGHLLVGPVVHEEFVQMSVKDCRDYVNSVENLLRKLASGAC
jgi:hypothetical protein